MLDWSISIERGGEEWENITSFVSRAARRSMGSIQRKKNRDRMAKPLAARVCCIVRGAHVRGAHGGWMKDQES